MGGLGSGGWNASGAATTTDHRRIDVGKMQHAGALEPGAAHIWSWARNGETTARISSIGREDGLALAYNWRLAGEEDWTSITQLINVAYTACRFGGSRPYFVCPRCSSRRLHLYGAGKYFYCRDCAQLTYQSRRERVRDRMLRRAQDLRERLGASLTLRSPLPPRPKHMRRATYDKLVSDIRDAEAAVYCELAHWLGRWERRSERASDRVEERQGSAFWS